MMLMGGISCLLMAIDPDNETFNDTLRFVVGAYGLVSIYFVWTGR